MLQRLASLGRPPRSVLWMFGIAIGMLVVGIVVLHGTAPTHVRLPGHGRRGTIEVTHTHAIDYIRTGLDIAAVVLALYALLRWGDARERPIRENEAQRHFGDSIVDARTRVDPMGRSPVNSEPRRH